MNAVEKRVLEEGILIDDHIVRVDSFLNHQMDAKLMDEIAQLFYEKFKDVQVDRIVTCEASGIGIAVMVAHYFNKPMVFAKKNHSLNQGQENYQAKVFSYTKQKSAYFNINKNYLLAGERVLIIDDFLANGEAVRGLIEIINQAKAVVAGIGIVIEKGFQPGGQWLRDRDYNLHSLCVIESAQGGKITLRKEL